MLPDHESYLRAITQPTRLYIPSQVLGSIPSDVKKGVYAWWFRNIPPDVPVDGTVVADDRHLLYIGTGPVSPTSKSNLRERLRSHVSPDASRSTLRKSLGCILEFPFEITRKSKNNLHYGLGECEARLSQWLEKNARVSWAAHPSPWELESYLIKRLALPLNVDENGHCEFACRLHERRKALFAEARAKLGE